MSLMENGGMSAADMAAVLGNNRANNGLFGGESMVDTAESSYEQEEILKMIDQIRK